MCGIAGIVDIQAYNAPPGIELLRSMAALLRHRGPDSSGLYRDKHASLVHTRLAIVDVDNGRQPLSNEDGTIWIVFNGEVFNHVELRDELLGHGHRFRTRSDTEVIVHAFEQWGDGCFSRFNGQWALALWNRKERTLLLCRDRLGVRPLYIHEGSDGRIRFASEVKALFADPAVPCGIDPHGLDQTFTYWAPVAPVTPFRNVQELPPATFRVYGPGRHSAEHRYWMPAYPEEREHRMTVEEATEGLRERLTRATELRMLRADVPVGSYLSGGLDSSVVARLGREAKQEGPFQTFSLRFDDPEFDEAPFQHAMAATLSSSHQEIVVTRSDIAEVFPEVVWHAEKPLLRTAAAPLFLLSRLVRQTGIKAVLTGEGADEMLAGYDLFRETKIRSFWSNQPDSQTRPRLFERLYPYLARAPHHARGMATEFWKQDLGDWAAAPGFSHAPRWRTTSMLKKFFSPELKESLRAEPSPDILEDLPDGFSRWDELARAQYLETATLLSGYLLSSQGDRMLMAHSVEGRFPFLDKDVVDFCNMLPSLLKLPGLNEKSLLKRMARNLVPECILKRPKQPYRAPDAVSFLSPVVPDYVTEAMSEPLIRQSGLFDAWAVQRLFQKCLQHSTAAESGRELSNVDNMAFVGILSTQLLWKHSVVGSDVCRDGDELEFEAAIDWSEGTDKKKTENSTNARGEESYEF